jgi:hypothetical protein
VDVSDNIVRISDTDRKSFFSYDFRVPRLFGDEIVGVGVGVGAFISDGRMQEASANVGSHHRVLTTRLAFYPPHHPSRTPKSSLGLAMVVTSFFQSCQEKCRCSHVLTFHAG